MSLRNLVGIVTAAGLVVAPSAAHAFWEWESDETYLDARFFARSTTTRTENPPERLLYPNSSDASTQLAGRLLVDVELGDAIAMETNVLYTATARSARGPILWQRTLGAGRSEALRWDREHHEVAHAAVIDRWVLRASVLAESEHPVDIRIGRLPINLATTFYFTPNDFFSPFSADTFFRVYKPGVDGARVDIQLGDLSQVSAIAVAGYDPDESDRVPVLDRTSGLVRAVTSISDFEVAAVAGVIPDRAVVGGSFQGEWLEWLGVRGEGHYAAELGGDVGDRVEIAVGADHRFESTLTLRFEQLYHGSGFDDPDDYLNVIDDPDRVGLNLARHYSAAGVGYEVTPLLLADAFVLQNWTDGSSLWGINLVYSVSDEAEVSANATFPVGESADLSRFDALSLGTEYGLYPTAIAVDFRAWF